MVAKIGRAAVIDHDGRPGGKERGIPADSLDVLVPGHRPEAGSVRLFMPVDGVVIPQPRVLVSGMTMGIGGRRQEVDDTGHGVKIQSHVRCVKCLFEASALHVRMSFAAFTPRRHWLGGHLVLARHVDSPRFPRVQELSPRNVLHTFRLTSPADVDAEFVSWLAEACRVGCQQHLGR